MAASDLFRFTEVRLPPTRDSRTGETAGSTPGPPRADPPTTVKYVDNVVARYTGNDGSIDAARTGASAEFLKSDSYMRNSAQWRDLLRLTPRLGELLAGAANHRDPERFRADFQTAYQQNVGKPSLDSVINDNTLPALLDQLWSTFYAALFDRKQPREDLTLTLGWIRVSHLYFADDVRFASDAPVIGEVVPAIHPALLDQFAEAGEQADSKPPQREENAAAVAIRKEIALLELAYVAVERAYHDKIREAVARSQAQQEQLRKLAPQIDARINEQFGGAASGQAKETKTRATRAVKPGSATRPEIDLGPAPESPLSLTVKEVAKVAGDPKVMDLLERISVRFETMTSLEAMDRIREVLLHKNAELHRHSRTLRLRVEGGRPVMTVQSTLASEQE